MINYIKNNSVIFFLYTLTAGEISILFALFLFFGYGDVYFSIWNNGFKQAENECEQFYCSLLLNKLLTPCLEPNPLKERAGFRREKKRTTLI